MAGRMSLMGYLCIFAMLSLVASDSANPLDLLAMVVEGEAEAKLLPNSSVIQRDRGNGETQEKQAGEHLMQAQCGKRAELTLEHLKTGIQLGGDFLMNTQKETGNFRYEYNWQTKDYTDDDNSVRQAGTLWSITLLHADSPSDRLLETARSGIRFFAKNSYELPNSGRRIVRYPGEEKAGKTGTVALVALAHIELLRHPEHLQAEEKKQLEEHLHGYIKTLLHAEMDDHTFHKRIRGRDGKPYGESSSYYDGECLLALAKAAKYLGHDGLWHRLGPMANGGWKKNAKPGLKAVKKGEASTKEMKGYYQWSTMAMYELWSTGKKEYKNYADHILRYADWVRKRQASHGKANMGYAFEGLVPAYVVAVRTGDKKRAGALSCTLKRGLTNLYSMQVGHPRAKGLAKKAPSSDQSALGGCQGSVKSPLLRIDTTQHQMHAMLFAKNLFQHEVLV
eukprot:gnl/TRDRNA2_/TRDRNA2_179025_c0_seq1.p1 gnl/TRDRNA2_/TRDRNA2_179025_c0~~gnl/TRDRNA2_/TRDRNA2_179025_c0_seq1.p1  ORF type:complete len:450 (-),score=99.22 gnl/TRDRNA2_/TRDRNA2_179025_c0_seq1:375-1724(-)